MVLFLKLEAEKCRSLMEVRGPLSFLAISEIEMGIGAGIAQLDIMFSPSLQNSTAIHSTTAPQSETSVTPRFSILIPVEGHRGDLLDCLAGWRDQTIIRDHFEILLLSDGNDLGSPKEMAIRGLVDRILCEEGASQTCLYDLGARESRGHFLVFTESHCVPGPEFLNLLDLHLRATGHTGACCRMIPQSDNALARMDELLCEEGCSIYRQQGDWRKFNVQGVALARDAYLGVGGLQHRYDRFAEMLLAASLRDHGLTMSYAEKPTVRHRFRTNLRDVLADIEAYVGGENLYRAEHAGKDQVGHSFLPVLSQDEHKPQLLNNLARTLLADFLRQGWLRGQGVLRGAFLEATKRWLHGGRLAYWLATLGTWVSVAKCHLFRWHRKWLERAYRQVWVSASRRTRLGFLLDQWKPRPAQLVEQGRVAITDLADSDWFGLHALESYDGEPFRWTHRTAVIRLNLGRGEQEIVLETRGVRREPVPLELIAYLDGSRLPANAILVEADCVRLRIPKRPGSDQPSHLVLACRPIRPWKRGQPDQRELGLPLFAIRWR